jgi:hypothetical protein
LSLWPLLAGKGPGVYLHLSQLLQLQHLHQSQPQQLHVLLHLPRLLLYLLQVLSPLAGKGSSVHLHQLQLLQLLLQLLQLLQASSRLPRSQLLLLPVLSLLVCLLLLSYRGDDPHQKCCPLLQHLVQFLEHVRVVPLFNLHLAPPSKGPSVHLHLLQLL